MKSILTKPFYTVILLAFIALILNAAIPLYTISVLKLSNEKAIAVRANIEILDNLLINMVNAETGMRGYVITGNSQFLEPYYNSKLQIGVLLLQLENAWNSELTPINDLKQKISQSVEQIDEIISSRQTNGGSHATEMVMSGEGKLRMDAVRAAARKLRLLESDKLKKLEIHQSLVSVYTNAAMIFLTLSDLILFGLAFNYLLKSLRVAKDAQKDINALHDQSIKNTEYLNQKNHIKNLQARLNDMLQTIQTQEEAFKAISNYGKQIFPNYSGAFYVKSNSKDYFERKVQWGSVIQVEGFEPNECWAVRKNSIYSYDSHSLDMPCIHNGISQIHLTICLPTSSADEMLGVLTLIDPIADINQSPQFDKDMELVAKEVVGQIGLAITNLRLKENLKNSSIVDVLTGLYNRRYLNETFTRELARASRAKLTVGVIMFDVDHFKNFNDNHGHEAGDLILKKVGAVLKSSCRVSDIACRYGGEEFVLILPEATLELTEIRAEEIRVLIQSITLTYGGNLLPPITISAGISIFPDNGDDAESVLKKADDALYHAKNKGRNLIHVSY